MIGLDGLMTEEAGEFAGLSAAEARTAVIERLERDGLLSKPRITATRSEPVIAVAPPSSRSFLCNGSWI